MKCFARRSVFTDLKLLLMASLLTCWLCLFYFRSQFTCDWCEPDAWARPRKSIYTWIIAPVKRISTIKINFGHFKVSFFLSFFRPFFFFCLVYCSTFTLIFIFIYFTLPIAPEYSCQRCTFVGLCVRFSPCVKNIR